MSRLILLSLLLWHNRTDVQAQALIGRLAEAVCECMESAPEIVYPRMQATRCVEEVAERYASRIDSRLALDVSRAVDRRQLGELLVLPLSENCVFLQDIAPGVREPELRYSDIPLAERSESRKSAKLPPPDAVATTPREAPVRFEATGKVLRLMDKQHVELQMEDGERLRFELSPRLYKELEKKAGRRVELTYKLDWHGSDPYVRRIVIEAN